MTMEELFHAAIKKEASDLHLTYGLKPSVRINGELVELSKFEIVNDKLISDLLTQVLKKPQKEKLAQKMGLDFSFQMADLTRFRVNVHYERSHLGLVARLIPVQIPKMEELQMTDVMYDLTKIKSGLIIVTGPAGSGKSTTLASMIGKINNERRESIITLEDPIEFFHTPIKSIIKQRELGVDILAFHEGLRQALREDPNVIMVGEMRDLETISTTITVAETGHLVFATLHTDNAAQTINRIIDIFPPYQQDQVRMQLSMTLKAVIGQKLVPKMEGGRMAVREVLINTPAIANLIREEKTAQITNVIQTHSEEGMISFDQAFKSAYKKKMISKETADIYINDKTLI